MYLDSYKLFKVHDMTKEAAQTVKELGTDLFFIWQMLAMENEPEAEIGPACHSPYDCPCWDYCTKGIPEDKLVEHYSDYINCDEIEKFLKKLHYPLYFLDFETVQPVIPCYIGTRPYDQIPFMYSLHYIEDEGAPLRHTDFLAKTGTDPRRALAERLVADIPSGVCVTAYNKAFECTRIKELALQFPDLADRLLEIKDSIVDLIYPFQRGIYLLDEMHGSYSIKAVLPALYPDDPTLDYHNLELIHNGSEAMNAFAAMEEMSKEERMKTRQALRKYCKLDTYAMVKVWEKLREVIAEDM